MMRTFAYSASLLLVAAAMAARADNDVARAGYPQETSRFAKPADESRSIGYLLGGGALNWRKASPPGPNDGTWGWDYTGGWFRRRVNLGWWNGRRMQGGSGAYKTDGPKPFSE